MRDERTWDVEEKGKKGTVGDWKGGNGTCVRMLITTKTEIWKCSFLSPFHFERYFFLYFPSSSLFSSNFLFRAFLSLSLFYTHSQDNHSKGFSSFLPIPLLFTEPDRNVECARFQAETLQSKNVTLVDECINLAGFTCNFKCIDGEEEGREKGENEKGKKFILSETSHLSLDCLINGSWSHQLPFYSFLPIQVLPSRSVQLILHPMDLSVELVPKQLSVNPASFTMMKDSVLMDHPFRPVHQVDQPSSRICRQGSKCEPLKNSLLGVEESELCDREQVIVSGAKEGTVCTLYRPPGFRLKGHFSSITCTFNRVWNPPPDTFPFCILYSTFLSRNTSGIPWRKNLMWN